MIDPAEMDEIRARDRAVVPRFAPLLGDGQDPAFQPEKDRRALLAEVDAMRRLAGRLASIYLGSIIDQKLENGESVLAVVLEQNPTLAARLRSALGMEP